LVITGFSAVEAGDAVASS